MKQFCLTLLVSVSFLAEAKEFLPAVRVDSGIKARLWRIVNKEVSGRPEYTLLRIDEESKKEDINSRYYTEAPRYSITSKLYFPHPYGPIESMDTYAIPDVLYTQWLIDSKAIEIKEAIANTLETAVQDLLRADLNESLHKMKQKIKSLEERIQKLEQERK